MLKAVRCALCCSRQTVDSALAALLTARPAVRLNLGFAYQLAALQQNLRSSPTVRLCHALG